MVNKEIKEPSLTAQFHAMIGKKTMCKCCGKEFIVKKGKTLFLGYEVRDPQFTRVRFNFFCSEQCKQKWKC